MHNPDGILYGTLPGYHLAASGRLMAQEVAAYLAAAGADIAYVAASSLDRAQETAAPVAKLAGTTTVTDDRLIEAANVFAGKSVSARSFLAPVTWPKLVHPLRPSWGEPYLEVAHRMLGAVQTAVDRATGREAVLVSHQLPIWTIRRYLTGHRLWHNPNRRECALASLTSLLFVDGVFRAVRYREPAAHIPAVDDPAPREGSQ